MAQTLFALSLSVEGLPPRKRPGFDWLLISTCHRRVGMSCKSMNPP